jgi:hypothetical protein
MNVAPISDAGACCGAANAGIVSGPRKWVEHCPLQLFQIDTAAAGIQLV